MDGYELLGEDKIPRCCGSCKFIRYRGPDHYHKFVDPLPFCKKEEELICIFGLCLKYKPSKLIFIKGE